MWRCQSRVLDLLAKSPATAIDDQRNLRAKNGQVEISAMHSASRSLPKMEVTWLCEDMDC
jgi:hypothetical protein